MLRMSLITALFIVGATTLLPRLDAQALKALGVAVELSSELEKANKLLDYYKEVQELAESEDSEAEKKKAIKALERDVDEDGKADKDNEFGADWVKARVKAVATKLAQYQPPSLPDSSDPAYSTKGVEENDKRAEKMLAYYRALKAHVERLEADTSQIETVVDNLNVAKEAAKAIEKAFETILENFSDPWNFFAMAWFDAQDMNNAASEAHSDAVGEHKDHKKLLAERRQLFENYVNNTKLLLESWKIEVPADLKKDFEAIEDSN